MTPLQRRGHLLGIFYYRSPEARDRRIAKMLEDALAFAGRKPKKQKIAISQVPSRSLLLTAHINRRIYV